MIRYLRAFVVALGMTLRGQRPPPPTPLEAWMTQTEALVDAVCKAADQAGLVTAQRKVLKLRIEGRDVSLDAVLGGVKFHVTQEYRYLLRHPTEHSLTAIYASNLNDQFRVARFSALVTAPGVQAALEALTRHLEAIPPSAGQDGKS